MGDNIPRLQIKSVLVFLMHQAIATLGVVVAAYIPTLILVDFLFPERPQFLSEHDVSRLLTQLPYFPVQILEGLCLGWALGRGLRQRAMLWVWVLPALILCYAFINPPNISPGFTSAVALTFRNKSVRSHFFGSACRADIEDGCLDQLTFTMPFYASAAYSIGALLARLRRQKPVAEIGTS